MANNNNQTPMQNQPAPMTDEQAVQAQKKKKKKRTIIILASVAAALVLLFIIIGIGGSSSGEPEKVDGESSVTTSAADDSTEQKSVYTAGETIKVDDLKISFTSCDTDFKKYEQYSAPKSGMKYVRATFTFENTSSTDISLGSFECYADDTAYEAAYLMDDSKTTDLETISAGKKFNAVLYYEVPKDAKNVILQYEADYWSDEKIEFAIK